jgi:hypothetical protein
MVAAAAAALGLGEDNEDEQEEDVASGEDPEDPAEWEEESVVEEEEDNPPLDTEAIEELRAEFRNSLVRVFDCSELAAQVLQDKLYLNEPVDLLQAWGSDTALEYASNNLIRGAHHMVPAPVFR